MLRKLLFIVSLIVVLPFYLKASTDIPASSKTGIVSSAVLIHHGDIPDSDEPDAAAYKKAYNLVLDQKWNEAIKEFEAFIKKFPNSGWKDDANFWMCYSKDKAGYNLEEVFNCYQDFINNNKRSKWADDARSNMIVVGQKLVKQGKVEYKSLIENLTKQRRKFKIEQSQIVMVFRNQCYVKITCLHFPLTAVFS